MTEVSYRVYHISCNTERCTFASEHNTLLWFLARSFNEAHIDLSGIWVMPTKPTEPLIKLRNF
ncbi:hypothetical protein CANARDRAFT_173751 [[Candida] arabinofermentans NRRL YB-2248]|uniref:Uncharacterized protein n=1 Tax=[Candida] arabinofermentans NRRL YB-2248 TaxID=983967 RepID=A0A1E4T7Y3_9ASCO|nr:hypothetical protein CANARDRAFT_173751 [[Candida] arabinofermentans NRRL YB-2248]